MPTIIPQSLSVRSRLTQWWSNQSPARQDRYAMLAPVVAVFLFMLAITTSFLYLRYEELDRDQEAVRRDTEYAHQSMRLRLLEHQEQLLRIARDLANNELDRAGFMERAEKFVNETPEVFELTWLDNNRKVIRGFSDASAPSQAIYYPAEVLSSKELGTTFDTARKSKKAQYSPSLPIEGLTDYLIQMHVPLISASGVSGVLMAQYSVDGLLRYAMPSDLKPQYAVGFLDSNEKLLVGNIRANRTLSSRILPWTSEESSYLLPVAPMNNGLQVKLQAYRVSQGVIGTTVYWLVAVLSFMTAWMLIGTFRHTRKRIRTQQALVNETAFRRAMENSMVTGMRALDLNGKITYVNPAFSQMTGWNESELVGLTAPFPYWPDEDQAVLNTRLTEELQGKTIPGGFEMRVKRKNGTLFDARMYVAPLIDANGHQSGWMTSMTDITEPKRIREELTASYERFTTVLEGLDASVSVAPIGSEELLFANKRYRQWFEGHPKGHHTLIELAGLRDDAPSTDTMVDEMVGLPSSELVQASNESTDSAEVFVPELEKWLEVRARYLNWVDGRLVQILIASDITARRHAEEMAQSQTVRAQNASRLITMGEMASSVAHELNQPLTAINNYCTGLVSRIKSRNLSEHDLIGALEKTSRQAQRAGQIIQRIRNFVKKSEPNRSWSEVNVLVAEAVELVEIEIKRRNVRLIRHLNPRLPRILVDPILIEQVLINLLKNAAESVDSAQRSAGHRLVELRVEALADLESGKPMVRFTVQDTGTGLSPEVKERLFEAFFSTKSEGMGIGLSLCRSIVESHQGRMQAENLYNGEQITGCRFSIWLPVGQLDSSTTDTAGANP